jgi:membrane-associated phospholipid phosphatase
MLTNWDRSTFLAINHGLKCGPMDVAMPPFSYLGLGHVQVVLILAVAILCGVFAGQVQRRTLGPDVRSAIYNRRFWVGPLLVALALSGTSATLIKNLTDRDRPWWFYHKEHKAGLFLNVRVHVPTGWRPIRVRGFLSGHTATTFALCVTLMLLFRKRREKRALVMGGWILAFLIGLSRIYVADHWPLDVVSGIALGVASGFLAMAICRQWSRRHCMEGATLPPQETLPSAGEASG